MSQSLSHIQTQMAEKRRQRHHDSQSIGEANEMSETLRSYGKEMFNYAVKQAVTGSPMVDLRVPVNENAEENTRKTRPLRHSGPTKSGSPIYNKKPELMNSIRIRPKSETIHSVYNHQQSKLLPSLKQYISKHNEEYNLEVTPGQNIDLKETKLVPIHSELSNYQTSPDPLEDTGSDNGASTIADEQMPELEKLAESEKDIDEPTPTLDENENEKKVSKVPKLNPNSNTPTEQVRPKLRKQESVVKEDVDSKEKKGKKTPTGKKAAGDNNRPNSQAKSSGKGSRGGNAKSRPSSKLSKQSTQDTEEEEEEEEEEEPRPYFHCWVDDVTISSVQGDASARDAELDPSENQANKDELAKDNPCNKALLEEAAGKLASMVNGGNIAEGTHGIELTKDAGATPREPCLEEAENKLPDYICKISERKSKEIAIKQWIENTNFSHANKSVPLV